MVITTLFSYELFTSIPLFFIFLVKEGIATDLVDNVELKIIKILLLCYIL